MDGASQIRDFAEIYIITKRFDFSEAFTESTKDYTDTIPGNVEDIAKIKTIIDKKIEQLSLLEKQIDKISPLIGSKLANKMRFMINQCRSSIEWLNLNIDDFLAEMTKENWDAVVKIFNDEYLSKAGSLEKLIAKTGPKFVECIVFATQNNQLSKEDLEELAKLEGLTEKEKQLIEEATKQIKETQTEVEPVDENGNEEETIEAEEEKGEESTALAVNREAQVSEVVGEAQVAEPVRKTLDERLDSIEYRQGMNYSNAVSQVRIAFEIEELDKRIEALQSKREKSKKKKISFKEAVEMQKLVNQREMLREMEFGLSRKEKKTEKQMAKTDSQTQEKEAELAAEKERQEEASSRLFKYISHRKQQKLTETMQRLQAKMATMTMQQRQAALVKFDALNAKLEKRALKDARRQVRQQRFDEKIAELKALKARIVGEAKAIQSDISRFQHRPEVVERLQTREGPIVMVEQPGIIYLPEHIEELENEGPALAA